MSKLSMVEEVGEISADSAPKENPFKVEDGDMTYEELRDDRNGVPYGSPLEGWV